MSGKTADSGPATDLFGNPWEPPKDRRGRKRHKREAQIAEKVGVLRADGATQEEIAEAVGLSVPTLTKYYFRELTDGPAIARAELMAVLYDKAKGGNVPAIKAALAQFDKGDAKRADGRVKDRGRGGQGGAPPPAAKMGKKEERLEAARKVGAGASKFAPPAGPIRLAVDNG